MGKNIKITFENYCPISQGEDNHSTPKIIENYPRTDLQVKHYQTHDSDTRMYSVHKFYLTTIIQHI